MISAWYTSLWSTCSLLYRGEDKPIAYYIYLSIRYKVKEENCVRLFTCLYFGKGESLEHNIPTFNLPVNFNHFMTGAVIMWEGIECGFCRNVLRVQEQNSFGNNP